ncbi:MAG TPA: redoxin domain-containing protein [Candidatus Limnocylindrales bacterium]|nr:redoxin domain-containing protein [Candidatus Limnocylindrales bacterium]
MALLAVVVLWNLPRVVPQTGTLLVVAAGRTATTLPSSSLALRMAQGSWATVGSVSGKGPAAPEQRQLLAVSMAVGAYDSVRLGDAVEPVSLTITAGRVEPLLIGFDAGSLVPGAFYAGNDDVNLGLGELASKFVPMPAFELVDQAGRAVNVASLAGRDVVVAAFHTNCHETCPLYTALFLQLAKHLPSQAMLLEVTTDTADTPSVLQSYAKQVGARWTFATGTAEQLTSFWRPFSVELSGGDVHTSTLVLVDRHGYVRLVYRGVPKVGGDIPGQLVTSLSTRGLYQLGSGGDGWGAADLLQSLATIAGPERVQQSAGGKAAAFTLTSTDGTRMSLADLTGKPLVINFWATYCPPCKAEMPLLARMVGPQSGARLVLVNEGDTREATIAFLDGLGIHQSALLDSDLKVGHSYGIFMFPMTIFVRADGTIDRRQVGQLEENVLGAELSTLTSQ